ncbi:MAG: hypothetical protein AAFM91_04975 [Pseudomonadota bacterium]
MRASASERSLFIARHVAELGKSMPPHEAFRRVRNTLAPTYGPEIDALAQLFDAQAAEKKPSSKPAFPALTALLPHVPNNKAVFFQEFVDLLAEHRTVFKTFWHSFATLMLYVLFLFGIAVTVLAIYRFYVMTSFEGFFVTLGGQLPENTKFLLTWLPQVLPGLFAVWAVFFIAGMLVIYVGFKRIETFSPLPSWAARLPLVGRLARVYADGLFVHLLRLLRLHNVDETDAVKLASANAFGGERFVDQLSAAERITLNSTIDRLAAAERLGQLDEELDYLGQQYLLQAPLLLAKARDRVAFVVKLTLFVLVGAIVYAMYLPIFRMGAVV